MATYGSSYNLTANIDIPIKKDTPIASLVSECLFFIEDNDIRVYKVHGNTFVGAHIDVSLPDVSALVDVEEAIMRLGAYVSDVTPVTLYCNGEGQTEPEAKTILLGGKLSKTGICRAIKRGIDTLVEAGKRSELLQIISYLDQRDF